MNPEIIAAECLFPSGPTLALADIAVKTQFSLTRKHPLYVDRCGVRIRASYFPAIDSTGSVRWQVMLREMLSNLKAKLAALSVAGEYRLWMILPDAERPGVPDDLDTLLKQCATDIFPRWAEINVVRGGHAVAAVALREIMSEQKKSNRLCYDVIVGCESYIAAETLWQLESRKLIHNSYSFDSGRAVPNAYGFVPGEGAAAIVLTSGLSRGSQLISVGIGQEKNLRGMDTPCTGTGLASAATQALQGIKSGQLESIVSDLNGEPYRADEYGFALTRLHAFIPGEGYSNVTPVLATGDLGCISLITHLALMAHRYMQPGKNNRLYSLILSSSQDSLRSAVVLGSPGYAFN